MSKVFDMLGFKSKYDSWYALISIYQIELINFKKIYLVIKIENYSCIECLNDYNSDRPQATKNRTNTKLLEIISTTPCEYLKFLYFNLE